MKFVLLLKFAVPEEYPMPATQTGVSIPNSFTFSSDARISEDAPSVRGQQSYSLRGDAMTIEAMTSSTVTLFFKWAIGFIEPYLWFFTATIARSSSVVPNLAICAFAYKA